jgi:drug/metabolite transporter (DMT)-like permease
LSAIADEFSVGERRLAYALVFITPALWSVNYLVARWAPGVIAPHMLALGRWALAAAVLAAFCWREIAGKRRHVRAEAWQFVVFGALGMWVCGAFVYVGGRSTTAVNIGLIYAGSPVLIALASALWLHERFGARQWLGVAVAIAGVVHIIVKGRWQALAEVRINPGDAWIAVAMVCWAVYSLLLRAWPSAFSPLARLTLIACGGVLVLVPFTVIEAVWWWPSTLSWQSAALVVASALLPGAGAYGAYSVMQRVLGAARVGLVLYLGPLYAALAAWLLLGERIEPFHFGGAVLVLGGIALTTRK